jgi:hypothetical protein
LRNWSRNPFFWAFVVAAALVGASLISDSEDSWAEFFGWTVFLVALNTPLLFAPSDSNRFCAGWLSRGRKTE